MAFNAQSSLLKPTANIWRQLIRYGFSGALATLVDMSVLWFMTSIIGWYYQIGVCCGYVCGVVITYLLSTLWIFNQHRTSIQWLEILGFVLIGFIGLGATHLMMWMLVDCWLGEQLYLVAKIITVVVVSLLNFILKKYILFTK